MATMQRMFIISLAFTVFYMLIESAMAENHTVGAPNGGWDLSTNLQAWPSSHSFLVGDNLIFVYTASHDVLEVTKTDYDSCQGSNPIQTYIDGNTVVPLVTPGNRYFICGALGHCTAGMKVEITTLATSSPPAPPPTSPPTMNSTPPMSNPNPPPASPPTSILTPPPASSPPVISSSPPTNPPIVAENPSAPAISVPTPASSPLIESSAGLSPSVGATPPSRSPIQSPNDQLDVSPPPSSAYKRRFGVDVSIGIGFLLVLSQLLAF